MLVLILLEKFHIIAMYRLQTRGIRSMNEKRICIVCVIMIFVIMTGYHFEKKSEEEISMEPDVVSSISMNRDQYLTVVANRYRIEDKEEFAKLLVKMCKLNFEYDLPCDLPIDLAAYRLSGSKWRPLSDEIWIGDLSNETILDVYDSEVDEFVVYLSMGRPLETVSLKNKGVYRQAAIGFLCSYKQEYDFTFLAFLKQGKVKRAVFCNNKCQMRDETELIYDTVTKKLHINPWFYGRGNVCCEIFNAKDESVFRKENLVNDGIIEISDLVSFEKYSIVFTEKTKGLGLSLKKNREMRRFCRVFFARDDFTGREFKIREIYYARGYGNTQGYMLSRSYIRLLEKKEDGRFVAEIYIRELNSNLRSNIVKQVDVEICSDVINGNMEITVTKKGKPLTLDIQRNHVTDSPIIKGAEVMNYMVIVE